MPSRNEISLTAEQVQGLQWEVIEVTEDYRRSRAVYGVHPDGTPVYAYQKEILAAEEFLEGVKDLRNANEGRRWSEGMGSDKGGNLPLVHVSSVPLNVFYRDFASRHNDRDFMKHWLNSDAAEPFRVRKGKI
jgi:hypothetical protein